MIEFISVLVVFVFYGQIEAAYKPGDSCKLPVGINGRGVCTQLKNCDYLNELFEKEFVTPQDVETLTKSRCGTRGLVCCARPQPTFDPLTLLPDSKYCDVGSFDRIFGGSRAGLTDFPWMALVKIKRLNNKKETFACGAALITNRYLLTAAHCIDNTKWSIASVRLGENDLKTDPDCMYLSGEEECADPIEDIPVESVLTHEDFKFSPKGVWNDIALLRLSRSVNFTDFIAPICLPLDKKFKTEDFNSKTTLIAVGWGKTENVSKSDEKLFVKLDGVPLAECQKKLAKYSISNKQVCAGGKKDQDACKGDSGGPLALLQDTRFYHVGIVSYGIGCGREGNPGVYTKTSQYIDWILSKLEP